MNFSSLFNIKKNSDTRGACLKRRLFSALSCLMLLCCTLAGVFAGCAAPNMVESGPKCTLYIECGTILKNIDELDPEKLEILPENGIIFAEAEVSFVEGESVYELLVRELRLAGIHMDAEYTPVYESAYIKGIANLYEFDCGAGSGWTYSVNGVFPNYGCSQYTVEAGDRIEFHYTCDFGLDVGCTVGQ